MDLRIVFHNCNVSKLVVAFLLFLFSLLLSVRLDGSIRWSYWAVFTPIWLWNLLVIAGAISGIVIYCKQASRSQEDKVEFKSMLIAFTFHMFLFIFELMLCANLAGATIPFRIVFIPLFLLSPLGILACIWAFRNKRSLELETLAVINIFQYIFISLQLDNVIRWHWVYVFIPLWIVYGICGFVVIYYISWSIIYMRSGIIADEQRNLYIYSTVVATIVWASLLAFQILLSSRLDDANQFYFVTILIPLDLAILAMMLSSFGRKGGNRWWFGLKEHPCEMLLTQCPCLQEYGNVKFNLTLRNQRMDYNESRSQAQKKQGKERSITTGKCVVAEVKLDIPD